MSAPLSPIPNDAPLVDQSSFRIDKRWYIWLYEVWSRVRTLVGVVGSPVAVANLTAAVVGATAYTVVQNGLYRVSYYLRATVLPAGAWSLTVTIGWREAGLTRNVSFAPLTGAPGTLAAAVQSNQVPVRSDSGSLITYSVAVTSGAGLVYAIDVSTELVN